MHPWTSISLAAAITATPLVAQPAMEPATQTCPADPVAPPPEMASWRERVAVNAGATPKAAALLTPGKGADVTLLATPDVTYPVPPSHPGGSVSHGGLLAFAIAEAGTYRVAIGSGAWIEVVRDGKPVTSSAHSPGPACTGLRKMVDFPLTPGRYLLEIAGNGTATLPVLVARLP